MKPNDIYIGRQAFLRGLMIPASKWQNSFKLKDFNNEYNLVLKKYLEYMVHDRKDLLQQLHELSGKRLVCWCAPLQCHGDVLVRLFRFYVLGIPDNLIETLLCNKQTDDKSPKKNVFTVMIILVIEALIFNKARKKKQLEHMDLEITLSKPSL